MFKWSMICISRVIPLYKHNTFELKIRQDKYMAWIMMIIFEPKKCRYKFNILSADSYKFYILINV